MPTTDLLLAERARLERPYFEEVVRDHSTRTIALPWITIEPVGRVALAELLSASMTTYGYETHPA